MYHHNYILNQVNQISTLLLRTVVIIVGLSQALYAQVTVTFPTSRFVFQRSNANRATIYITGRCPANTTQIQARLSARQGGTSTPWFVLDGAPDNGTFQGAALDIVGGWYDLDVKAFNGFAEIGAAYVGRVGVGEVFVVSGQSNSWGGSFVEGQALEDRVSMVLQPNAYYNGPGNFEEHELTLNAVAATLGAGGQSGMAPAAPVFMWGALGDRLVQRLGVPVMFFGGSHPGSRSTDWFAAASGEQNVGNGYYNRNAPYRALGSAMLHYLKRTGVRAVLWHQGESDNYYRTRDEYVSQIGFVINRTRQQSGFSQLGWVVSRVSYLHASFGAEYVNHETDPNIIEAQNILASQPNNWPGPATDGLIYPDYRVEDAFHVHFGGQDCIRLADIWSQTLSDAFFTSVQPSLPTRPILLTTGYVFPFVTSPGQSVNVPLLSAVPTRADNTYEVDLVSESGCALATVGSGTGNLIPVTLPSWANGRYRLRVRSTSPAVIGELGEPITVNGSGAGVPPGYTPGPLTTIRAGRWDDPTIWSCTRLPDASDAVYINHSVTVPANGLYRAQKVILNAGSKLLYEHNGRLALGQ